MNAREHMILELWNLYREAGHLKRWTPMMKKRCRDLECELCR